MLNQNGFQRLNMDPKQVEGTQKVFFFPSSNSVGFDYTSSEVPPGTQRRSCWRLAARRLPAIVKVTPGLYWCLESVLMSSSEKGLGV